MRWHGAPVVINVVIVVTGSKIISLGVYFGGARARAPLFANFSSSSHPALPDHPPVSVFLDPRSLLISSSPSEQYPSLHHVFGLIYQLNSALQFLFHLPSPSKTVFLRFTKKISFYPQNFLMNFFRHQALRFADDQC